MKKLIAIALVVLMIFALAGCNSSDYNKAQKLAESGDYAAAYELFGILGDYKDCPARMTETLNLATKAAASGEWQSDKINIIEEAKKYLESSQDASMFGNLDVINLDEVNVILNMKFVDDGKYEITIDQDSFGAQAESIVKAIKEAIMPGLRAGFEEEIKAMGLPVEEIYSMYGVDNIDDLFKAALGMTMDEMFDTYMTKDTITKAIGEIKEEGTYEVKDGKLFFTCNGETMEGSYNLATGTIGATDKTFGGITYTKK